MSPSVNALAFQRKSIMKKGRLKTADSVNETHYACFQTTFDVMKRLNVDNLPNLYGFAEGISASVRVWGVRTILSDCLALR